MSALSKLTKVAKDDKENLLSFAIDAIKERATVGEVSLAIENAFGRYNAEAKISSNVYGKNFEDKKKINDIKESIKALENSRGKKPTLLVAKLGQDGHDRGAKVIASAFSDLGFKVELSNLFLTPKELLELSNKVNPDVVGISSHAGGHLALVKEFMGLLENNKNKYQVICGGVIPKKDYKKLYKLGVSEVFGPGTNILDASYKLINIIKYGKKSNI